MKRFGIFAYVLLATALLGGCATLPGVVTYQTLPAGGGEKYALFCQKSSSGICHVRIEAPNGDASLAAIEAGATQTLEHAELGAKFCVSSIEPGWLMCKMQSMYFGPAGSLVIRL